VALGEIGRILDLKAARSVETFAGELPVPAAPQKERAGGGFLRHPTADRRRRVARGRREEAVLVGNGGKATAGNEGRGGRRARWRL
jgi:hypothetical protein